MPALTHATEAPSPIPHTTELGVSEDYQMLQADSQHIKDINSLLMDEYGSSYPYPLCKIGPRDIFLIVVHRPSGRIIGSAKAVPYGETNETYEFGGLIVSEDHRGRNIGKWMTRMRLKLVRAIGCKLVLSEPVCYREDCASQHNLVKHGFLLVGLQLGKYPDLQHDILGTQPESVLMTMRWLEGETRLGDRHLFIPQPMLSIVRSFLPRYITDRGWEQVLTGEIPESIYHAGHHGGHCIGSEFLDIPANWEDSEALIARALCEGYQFSGVLAGLGRLPDGSYFDYVRLMRLEEEACRSFDFSKVHVADQLGSLKAFLRSRQDA
jgi:GNAT superfamily N-acetyltransferase